MNKILKSTLTSLAFLASFNFLFSQSTHEWNVNYDDTILLAKNDLIRFIGHNSKEEFILSGSSKRIEKDINETLTINNDTIRLFGGERVATKTITRVSDKHQLLRIVLEIDTENPDVETVAESEARAEKKKASIIYHAKAIKKMLDKPCAVRDILLEYKITDQSELEKNRLLSKVIKSIEICPRIADTHSGLPSPDIFSKIGGLDVTKYADGLAKFLVKRTKEELTIAFFEDFKAAIENPNNKDFKTLFPATASGLLLIGDEVYNYQRYIGLLREQFEKDLNQLPENFRKIIYSNREDYFNSQPQLKPILLSLSDIVLGVRNKTHPGEIIKAFNVADYKAYDQNLGAAFETIQLISESIREVDENRKNQYWVDKSVVKEVIQDEITFRIYLGLIAQKAMNLEIKFKGENNGLSELLFKMGDTYLSLKPIFNELITNAEIINALIKANQDSNKKLSPEDLSRYFNAVDEVFTSIVSTMDALGLEDQLEKVKEMTSGIKSFNGLYSSIVNKKYSAAILNLVLLYEEKLVHNENDSIQLKLIKKYGTFIASMLQAENSDDVAAVIEAHALPSGSSRIKRVSKFNISLNAYLGPYGGVEFPPGSASDETWVAGLTAPVGVAINWGRIGPKQEMSFSLFFSLIDIGALTEYRFNDDENEIAQIYLREIFSPGAFISVGLPKTPISLNLGWQQAALLREAGVGANETSLERSSRLSASIVVDIPLMNFKTKF